MDDLEKKQEQVSGTAEDVVAYVNYYGLSGDPFDPEKPLFFATAQLEKLQRLFNYLARFSRKLVVVTGPQGAGKTTLLENFVMTQEGSDKLCSFAALASDSPAQVLLEIVEQLQVPNLTGGESIEQLSVAVRDYSLDCLKEDNHCIVVIDDAELFEQPVLELIYQLSICKPDLRNGISFLLSGGPQLLANIQQVVPADNIEKAVFHQQIPPFGYEEVVKYLHFHFVENAGQSRAPFSQNELKEIFEKTEGLPGRINQAAKTVLLAGMANLLGTATEAEESKARSFKLAFAGLVFVIGASFLWWQLSGEPTTAQDAEKELIGQIERTDEAVLTKEVESAEAQTFVEPDQVVAEQALAIGQSEAGDVTAQAAESVVVDGNTGLQLERAVKSASGAKADNQQLQAPEAARATQSIEQTDEDGASQLASMEEVEARQVATYVDAEETVPQAEKEASLTGDAARILTFKPTDFTLQMLGSKQQENIKKILARLPDDNQAMYFEKEHKGAPWYVLIYGRYPDRAAANAAVAELPAALKGNKPWVRSVAGIQDAIRAAQ